jgi:hypothetical protein
LNYHHRDSGLVRKDQTRIFEIPGMRWGRKDGLTPLNLSSLRCDQEQALRGTNFMQSIRPDNTDPIPLRRPPPRMGIIMIRFVGLLVVAVGLLALAWSR